MILKNIIEQIQAVYPSESRTRIVFEINRALQQFCQRTGVLYSVVKLTKTADKIAEDTEAMTLTLQLPVDAYEVMSIDELYKSAYELEDDHLIIHTANSVNVPETLNVRYNRLPGLIVTDSEIPGIPEFLHDVLTSMVLAKLHRGAGQTDKFMVETGMVKEFEKEARRWVNSIHYRNTGAFAGDAMAYKIAYGSQALLAGENIIQLGKTFTTVNSYIVMFNPGQGTVQEPDPKERTTSTVKVIASQDISDFEFYAHGT